MSDTETSLRLTWDEMNLSFDSAGEMTTKVGERGAKVSCRKVDNPS